MSAAASSAHRRYVAHLNRCRKAEHFNFCQVCWDLLRDADAESWRRAALAADRELVGA